MQELITVYEQEHAQKPQGERELLDENASLRQKVRQQEMQLQTLEASEDNDTYFVCLCIVINACATSTTHSGCA